MSTTTKEEGTETGVTETQPSSELVAGAAHQVWWALLGLLALGGEETGEVLGALVRKGKEVEPCMSEEIKKAGRGFRDAVTAIGTQLKGIGQVSKGVSDALGAVGTEVKEVGQKIGKASGKVESFLDERISAAVERMGSSTKAEIDSLSQRVEELSSKIEKLSGPKPARVRPAAPGKTRKREPA